MEKTGLATKTSKDVELFRIDFGTPGDQLRIGPYFLRLSPSKRIDTPSA